MKPGTPTIPERTNHHAASGATVLLVAALGYALALLAISALPGNAKPGPVEHITQSSSAGQRSGNVADRAARANLFGVVPVQRKVVEVEPPKEAPVSSLNLRLLGVLATDDAKPGYAVIGATSNSEQVLGIGDSIDNVELREIHTAHVIIDNRGSLERLELPKLDLEGVAVFEPVAEPKRSNSASSNPGSNQLVDVATLPQTPGELRDYLVSNPTAISQLMSIGAHREDGKVVGYRLMPRQDASILRNYGIEPGDIVTSLNGVRLDNQRRGLKALRQLVTATSVDLMIKRNGAEIPISIALQ